MDPSRRSCALWSLSAGFPSKSLAVKEGAEPCSPLSSEGLPRPCVPSPASCAPVCCVASLGVLEPQRPPLPRLFPVSLSHLWLCVSCSSLLPGIPHMKTPGKDKAYGWPPGRPPWSRTPSPSPQPLPCPSLMETPQKLPSWRCPRLPPAPPSLADLCFPGGLPCGQLGERSRLLEEGLGSLRASRWVFPT